MSKITLLPSRSITNKFNYIDFDVLELICNIIVDNHAKCSITETIKLKFKTAHNCYIDDAISLCDIDESIKGKETVFIKTFLHEFRHWMQEKLLKVNFQKNYTDYTDDVTAYYNCPLEKDARIFVNKSWSSVRSLYKRIKKTNSKIMDANKTGITFTL
jgi:hypothetical protein